MSEVAREMGRETIEVIAEVANNGNGKGDKTMC